MRSHASRTKIENSKKDVSKKSPANEFDDIIYTVVPPHPYMNIKNTNDTFKNLQNVMPGEGGAVL